MQTKSQSGHHVHSPFCHVGQDIRNPSSDAQNWHSSFQTISFTKIVFSFQTGLQLRHTMYHHHIKRCESATSHTKRGENATSHKVKCQQRVSIQMVARLEDLVVLDCQLELHRGDQISRTPSEKGEQHL